MVSQSFFRKLRLVGVVGSIVQVKKLRPGGVEQLVQGHRADSWQGLDYYPGLH